MADFDTVYIQPVELQDIRAIQDIARKTWAATYAALIPGLPRLGNRSLAVSCVAP